MLLGFKDKRASAVTRIAYAEPEKRPLVFEGRVQGTIVSPRGTSGFGFDPIFLPQGKKQTFAQMGMDEKNLISHRKKAFEEFKKFLMK